MSSGHPPQVDAEALALSVLRAGASDSEAGTLAEALGGEVVQRKRNRRVLRIPVAKVVLFVKVFDAGARSEARAERDAYRRLAVTGIPAAALLAACEDDATGRAALVFEDAGDGLDAVVEREARHPGRLRRVLDRAARVVRQLHVAGFRFPDLLAWHLRVGGDGEVRLLDLARLERPRRSAPDDGARARDLGALLGTLPRLATDERARLRLFVGATADLDTARRRAFAGKALKETRRTRDRSRYRHRSVAYGPAEREALAALAPAGEFHAWFEGDVGTRLRLLPDRENRRIEHAGRTLFLKRHFRGSRAGVVELEGTLAFRRAGVPAWLPAVVGEDVDAGSFWLAAAAPGEPLDQLLRRSGAVPPRARTALARRLGLHAAALRRAGLFHRDFYLNHWIGRWRDDTGWELALIDLQRWGRIGFRAERWFVKDAAALWYSARDTGLTRADGLRFALVSLGAARVDRRVRKFIGAVLRRAAAMAARSGPR